MTVEKLLWRKMEPKVDALITRRLLAFQDALIERGQISRAGKVPDPEEIAPAPNHYNQESAA